MLDGLRISLARVSLRAVSSTPQRRKRVSRFVMRSTLLAVAALLGLCASSAHAVSPPPIYTVTNLNDGGAGSLWAAINQANANGKHIITFSVTGTITLASSLPAINVLLDISGPGSSQLTVNGNNNQVFSISSGAAMISGLTIANGYTSGNGGAITNAGTLTVSNCNFSNNAAGSSSSSLGGAI